MMRRHPSSGAAPSAQGELFKASKGQGGNGRQATIASYVARRKAKTGCVPTTIEVAKLFAISERRVVLHFRQLGLLP